MGLHNVILFSSFIVMLSFEVILFGIFFFLICLSLLVYKLCENEDGGLLVMTIARALRIFSDPFPGIQVLFKEWVNKWMNKSMNEQMNKGSDQQTDATVHTAELSLCL